MASVIIHRQDEKINAMRQYRVYIDDVQVGFIDNAATKNFKVNPGNHKLTLKIDWCSSADVLFKINNENDTKTFQVNNLKSLSKMTIPVLAILMIEFVLYRRHFYNYLYILLVPLFLIIAYHVAIGRKRYLALTMMDG